MLRAVHDADLAIFFEHQCEPEAHRMAAIRPRERDAFMRHWRAKVLAGPSVLVRAIVVSNTVVGNILSWNESNMRLVGYWIGREYWGRGIATEALSAFLREELIRPLHAYVAIHNLASMRVLQKCGFICLEDTQVGSDGVAERLLRLESD